MGKISAPMDFAAKVFVDLEKQEGNFTKNKKKEELS